VGEKRVAGHLYVVGEIDDPTGAVKIGITRGRLSLTGRGGLNAGNWRVLTTLGHKPIAPAETRWTEWLIHQRLRPFHRRGEWFDVRDLVVEDDWARFLDEAISGSLRGLFDVPLGVAGHRLRSVSDVSIGPGRHFEAICECGERIDGTPGRALPTVVRSFVSGHGGISPDDPRLPQLLIEPHNPAFKIEPSG
jgi:hypothetical protein